MKIIVTGGAGFIASHIVDKYIELGHEVIVVDDLSGGFEKNINPKAKFEKIDIRSPEMAELIFLERPDVINHHAAQASVSVSAKQPNVDADININGSLNIILAAVKAQVGKIIYANTGGALFGEPESLPVNEKTPIHPVQPYGVSKYAVERYLYAYNAMEGLNYTSLRYSNVFGPRQNPHGEAGVVAIFTGLILEGKKPTIFGDGTKTRDYIYIKDVVDANVKALETGDGAEVLIGSGRQVKDIEVYESVRDALESDVEAEMGPFRKGDYLHMRFDTSLAKEKLDWECKTSFEDGIKETVEWFRENNKNKQ